MSIRTTAARKSVSNDTLTIEVDLPGFKKDTLELDIRGDLRGYTILEGLVGKGTVEDTREEFVLILDYDPRKLDTTAAKATLVDGVLSISIPVARAFAKQSVTIE